MDSLYYEQKSPFHLYREKYQPKVPAILKEEQLESLEEACTVPENIQELFPGITKEGVTAINFKASSRKAEYNSPLRVGCVLSGGQAPGGHNVISGIYDYIKRKHKNSQLFGFLNGPKGIYKGEYVELTASMVDYFRNRGGFDMIRSGRDKIESEEHKESSLKHCESLKLDGLVIIGGDDSNTNAAILAEYFLQKGSGVRVVGCPKTIDGDLKNEFI